MALIILNMGRQIYCKFPFLGLTCTDVFLLFIFVCAAAPHEMFNRESSDAPSTFMPKMLSSLSI